MVALQGNRWTTRSLRGVALLVLAVEGAVDWGYALPMALGGLLDRYLGDRRGEPVCLARSRHGDRLRCSGVLSLDPVRASGVL